MWHVTIEPIVHVKRDYETKSLKNKGLWNKESMWKWTMKPIVYVEIVTSIQVSFNKVLQYF